jgi:hypothetical protein
MVEPLYSNQSLSTDLLRNLRWLPEAKQRPALIENVMLDTEVAAMNCRFVHRCAVVLRQPLIRAPRGCRSWMGTSKGVIVGENAHGGGRTRGRCQDAVQDEGAIEPSRWTALRNTNDIKNADVTYIEVRNVYRTQLR